MSLLTPAERRQLRLFGWFLLILNGVIISAGVVAGKRIDDSGAGWFFVAALAVVVDGAFGLIVGANTAVVTLVQWQKGRRGRKGR